MMEIALETGATIVGQSFHKFSPGGVTGVLAIADSQLSIHTIRTVNLITLDFYLIAVHSSFIYSRI